MLLHAHTPLAFLSVLIHMRYRVARTISVPALVNNCVHIHEQYML